jgi:hypothetical protein
LEIAVTKNEDLRIHALDRTITEKKNWTLKNYTNKFLRLETNYTFLFFSDL